MEGAWPARGIVPGGIERVVHDVIQHFVLIGPIARAALTPGHPTGRRLDLRVGLSELVASLAASDARIAWNLPASIDLLGHDFHVCRVDAESLTAEVIDDHAGRDLFGMEEFPGDSVCLMNGCPTSGAEPAVPGGHGLRVVLASSPQPAGVGDSNLVPELSQHGRHGTGVCTDYDHRHG